MQYQRLRLFHQQKELQHEVFMAFGHGDGGGGPTREMIAAMRSSARVSAAIASSRKPAVLMLRRVSKIILFVQAATIRERPRCEKLAKVAARNAAECPSHPDTWARLSSETLPHGRGSDQLIATVTVLLIWPSAVVMVTGTALPV